MVHPSAASPPTGGAPPPCGPGGVGLTAMSAAGPAGPTSTGASSTGPGGPTATAMSASGPPGPTPPSSGSGPTPPPPGDGPAPPNDATWQQVAETPEFQELVAKKRAWIVPATVFFLFWYLLFILMAGYAEDFMGGEFLVDGLTVGYVFALSQFVMTFGLALAYVRRSRDVFDPLRVRALERAAEIANEPVPETVLTEDGGARPDAPDQEGGVR